LAEKSMEDLDLSAADRQRIREIDDNGLLRTPMNCAPMVRD